MFLNYVNSDDILGQINVNRLIYRTSTLWGAVCVKIIKREGFVNTPGDI